jgi:carbon monoxide dehydrogenase subunit G
MPSITCTTRINAPQERVFGVFSDLRSAPERVSGIKRLEVLTDGPIGKGTRFKETRVFLKKEATETMEITSFEAPRSYTVEANSCGCHYVSKLGFRPEGNTTVVDMHFDWTPKTFAAKLMSFMSFMMMGACRKAIEKDFSELKAFIERPR